MHSCCCQLWLCDLDDGVGHLPRYAYNQMSCAVKTKTSPFAGTKIRKKRTVSRFFYRRIGYPLVINLFQTLLEHPLDYLHLLDRDIGLDQLRVRKTLADDGIHQGRDALRRIILQRAGSSLYGIGHEHDDLFLSRRQLTMVHERLLVLRISTRIAVLCIKIESNSPGMMRTDKVYHHLRELVLTGYLHSVVHVPDNLLGTFLRREALVLIETGWSILYETLGIVHLSDIMVESPYPGQNHIGSDLTGSF